RRDDRRAIRRDVVRVDAAGPEEEDDVRGQDHPHELVDPVRLARPRPLVEAREVLGGTRVLVDLLLHLGFATRTPAAGYLLFARSSAFSQPASSSSRRSSDIDGS